MAAAFADLEAAAVDTGMPPPPVGAEKADLLEAVAAHARAMTGLLASVAAAAPPGAMPPGLGAEVRALVGGVGGGGGAAAGVAAVPVAAAAPPQRAVTRRGGGEG